LHPKQQTMAKAKTHAPRFNKGETVWLTFSDDKPEQKVIKESWFLDAIRIYKYSFEGTDISCGEMNLRRKLTDKKLTMTDCMHDEGNNSPAMNILDEGFSVNSPAPNGIQMEGIYTFSGGLGNLFFRPDKAFKQWLIDYAAGRIIIDVGCGTATLINDLADMGAKVMGIEPMWSAEDMMGLTKHRLEQGKGIINIMPRTVQDCEQLLQAIGGKAIMLFCRPCHSNFVVEALDMKHPDTEVLYITVPENLTKYDDLGDYMDSAVKLDHKGWSADKEVVYSIK